MGNFLLLRYLKSYICNSVANYGKFSPCCTCIAKICIKLTGELHRNNSFVELRFIKKVASEIEFFAFCDYIIYVT